ncbi:MAG: DUF3153 domain-containing protein [Synechococcus sp.]
MKLGKQSWRWISHLGKHLLLGCLVLLLCTGCVQYQMELTFNWLSGGTIVQNLKWDTSVSDFVGQFSDIAADELFAEVKQRATAAGGTAHSLSNSEIRVEIPFDDYTQLEGKFNTFFDRPLLLISGLKTVASANPTVAPHLFYPKVTGFAAADKLQLQQSKPHQPMTAAVGYKNSSTTLGEALDTESQDSASHQLSDRFSPPSVAEPSPASPKIAPAHLFHLAQIGGQPDFQVSKHSFFVADRYDLSYTLDLSDVKIPISGGFLTLSADRLLDLRIALQTPIAASHSNATVREGNRLEWHLNTGNLNHLTASFWTPSPVGIVLLVGIAVAAFGYAWRLDRPERKG